MLVIRLQRTGRKNIAAYRLVVAEKSAPIKGGVKEYLGHYLPMRTPHEFSCNKERITHWLKYGAQPSDTVARLLKNDGMEGLEKFVKTYTKKKKRNEEEVKPQAAAPPKPAEKPVEEKPKAEEKAKEAPKEEAKEPEAPKAEVKDDGDSTEKTE